MAFGHLFAAPVDCRQDGRDNFTAKEVVKELDGQAASEFGHGDFGPVAPSWRRVAWPAGGSCRWWL